jgi:hypothetical protein
MGKRKYPFELVEPIYQYVAITASEATLLDSGESATEIEAADLINEHWQKNQKELPGYGFRIKLIGGWTAGESAKLEDTLIGVRNQQIRYMRAVERIAASLNLPIDEAVQKMGRLEAEGTGDPELAELIANPIVQRELALANSPSEEDVDTAYRLAVDTLRIRRTIIDWKEHHTKCLPLSLRAKLAEIIDEILTEEEPEKKDLLIDSEN